MEGNHGNHRLSSIFLVNGTVLPKKPDYTNIRFHCKSSRFKRKEINHPSLNLALYDLDKEPKSFNRSL
jgi:hypothetical protein